jgi:glycine cleavage system aminomethyltransferase T
LYVLKTTSIWAATQPLTHASLQKLVTDGNVTIKSVTHTMATHRLQGPDARCTASF